MSNREIFENHALNLGKLVGNLLTIEMAARLAIVKLDSHAASQVFTQLPQVKEGDQIEWNAFTNSDDLRQTLEKYNKRAPSTCKIDVSSIVNLRDALAHGRTFGSGEMTHLRLLKFNRKKQQGNILVTFAQDMTGEWFRKNIEMLNFAIAKVATAIDYEMREFLD